MDPISAKAGAGGLSNVAGELSKSGGLNKGGGAKFDQVRMDKAGGNDPLSKVDAMKDNFMRSGKLEGNKAPSMAERVAARDGIAFQPNLQFGNVGGASPTQNVWQPQQVQATGESQKVANAVQGLNESQTRLDAILGELKSGKQYSQQELIGLQAEVNMLSEQVQMSTKLVDSAMQSIKSVMQQQV